VKLVRRGQIDRDLMNVILANVRTPVEREGDLLAQLSAMVRGAVRLREMALRYGLKKLRQASAALLDYSGRMTASVIGGLPDGRYEFEDRLDDAWPGSPPVKVCVAVTIRGERAVVDFSGSDAQVAGPVNANLAVTQAAVFYVFRCLLADDVPACSGLLRPIEIIAPEGTVVNALAPAAMAAGNVEMSQRITDVLLGALAKAASDRIPAASSGTMNNVTFGGWDIARNRSFAWYETIAGGMGASASADGMSAVHTHMTNSWNTPVEAFENASPVLIRQYRVRRGSGGNGKHRGGDGIVREFEFTVPAEATVLADRRLFRPYGLAGGEPGMSGVTTHIPAKGAPRILPGKVRLTLAPGDRLRIETPGGGGFGTPD
jgi:N-methylhydantoinase B